MLANYTTYTVPGRSLGYIFMILFWALILLAIAALIKWIWHDHDTASGKYSKMSALDVLKKRYAKGEITKKKFEAMKKDIA